MAKPRPNGKSYGWTAPIYATAERLVFGDQLVNARLALLPWLGGATHILILGEGDGRFLEALVKQNPTAKLVVVDRSQRMLTRAARRIRKDADVQFIRQDAHRFLSDTTSTRQFDAIVTLFLLDCMPESEVSALVIRANEHLKPDGSWLWSDFVIPSGPLRPIARLMLTLLYWFFRATTDTTATVLVDPTPFFQAVGLRAVAQSFALWGMVESRYMCRAGQNVTHD